jgi:hypothetical protein
MYRTWRPWEVENLRAAVVSKSRAQLAEMFGRTRPSIDWAIRKYCRTRDRAAIIQRSLQQQERTMGQSLVSIRQDNIRIRNSHAGWPQAETEPERRILEALHEHGSLQFRQLWRACRVANCTRVVACLRRLASVGAVRKQEGTRQAPWVLLVAKWSDQSPP